MDNNIFLKSKDFIEERDYRWNFIKDKGLEQMLCSRILINGRPISTKTLQRTFKVKEWSDLKKSLLAVWLESYELIKTTMGNERTFSGNS